MKYWTYCGQSGLSPDSAAGCWDRALPTRPWRIQILLTPKEASLGVKVKGIAERPQGGNWCCSYCWKFLPRFPSPALGRPWLKAIFHLFVNFSLKCNDHWKKCTNLGCTTQAFSQMNIPVFLPAQLRNRTFPASRASPHSAIPFLRAAVPTEITTLTSNLLLYVLPGVTCLWFPNMTFMR